MFRVIIRIGSYLGSKPLKWIYLAGLCVLAGCTTHIKPQPSSDLLDPIIPLEPAHEDGDRTDKSHSEPSTQLVDDRLDFSGLSGWPQVDFISALKAFTISCEALDKRDDQDWMNPRASYAGQVKDWRNVCLEAGLLKSVMPDSLPAREFFERNFTPVRVSKTGRLTGYYEPIIEARSQADGEFSMAIRARPSDLITGDLGQFIANLDGDPIGGPSSAETFELYRSRQQIEAENMGVILAWGRPIEVYFLQIQGSGRLVFEDGRQTRLRFAAHNSHPYVSIGRILIKRGELNPNQASKQDIEAWLRARGPLAWRPLFDENPRYVFFKMVSDFNAERGPIGSQGVALTPMASLAVDPAYHAWGVPVFIKAAIDGMPDWRGLVIAQDSGGAIKGITRGDLFFGWGDEAGKRAGRQNDPSAEWVLLLPSTLLAQMDE